MTTTSEGVQETAVTKAIELVAKEIRRAISEKVSQISNFPKIAFATDEGLGYVDSDEIGSFTYYKTDFYPGIPLFRGKEPFASSDRMIVLLPDGIFRFEMTDGGLMLDSGAFRNLIQRFPKFSSRTADNLLVISYGERALAALGRRPVVERIWGSVVQGVYADVGQDFCRSCGTVQSADVLFREDRCQNKNCSFPQDWLYESY
ncbi:MAG: hypothetical protein AAB627_02145 [Patescibacteria group bacterium]